MTVNDSIAISFSSAAFFHKDITKEVDFRLRQPNQAASSSDCQGKRYHEGPSQRPEQK